MTILPGVEEVKKTDDITVVEPAHDLQLAVLESLVLGRSGGANRRSGSGERRPGSEEEFRKWSQEQGVQKLTSGLGSETEQKQKQEYEADKGM